MENKLKPENQGGKTVSNNRQSGFWLTHFHCLLHPEICTFLNANKKHWLTHTCMSSTLHYLTLYSWATEGLAQGASSGSLVDVRFELTLHFKHKSTTSLPSHSPAQCTCCVFPFCTDQNHYPILYLSADSETLLLSLYASSVYPRRHRHIHR